jgi:hypothetical protein
MLRLMEVLAVVFTAMWMLGVGPLHMKSDLIHVLLALALAAVLYRLVMGRPSHA